MSYTPRNHLVTDNINTTNKTYILCYSHQRFGLKASECYMPDICPMSSTQSNHRNTDVCNSIPVDYNVNSTIDGYIGVFSKLMNSQPFEDNNKCVKNKPVCYNTRPISSNSKPVIYNTCSKSYNVKPIGFNIFIFIAPKSLESLLKKVEIPIKNVKTI